MQAHGTIYKLRHEPFVVFDVMVGNYRLPYDKFMVVVKPGNFTTPYLIHRGNPISVETALNRLGTFGHHGATDEVEGFVIRVQRRGEVDFLVKYLKPYKKDGIYLSSVSGKDDVWNWYPPDMKDGDIGYER